MRRSLLCAFILLNFFIGKGQTAAEYADMADKKLEKEDYQYALVMIDKAIAINDTNQWYYLKKADIELKLYGPTEATAMALKAISINRKNPEPYNRAGTFYNSRGISDSAIYMYNMAIKYGRNDTVKYIYLNNRGNVKVNIRDFEGARADYEKALQFDPNQPATLNNLATVYSELGMHQKGIEALKKITKIEPTFIGPYVNLGFIYSEMDSLDLALDFFNKAMALNPEDALIYSNRGHVFYKKGLYNAALKDINYSISLYPTNSYAYRNLALVYIATKKKSETCNALHYAENYGFEKMYGNEVNELIKKHCK